MNAATPAMFPGRRPSVRSSGFTEDPSTCAWTQRVRGRRNSARTVLSPGKRSAPSLGGPLLAVRRPGRHRSPADTRTPRTTIMGRAPVGACRRCLKTDLPAGRTQSGARLGLFSRQPASTSATMVSAMLGNPADAVSFAIPSSCDGVAEALFPLLPHERGSWGGAERSASSDSCHAEEQSGRETPGPRSSSGNNVLRRRTAFASTAMPNRRFQLTPALGRPLRGLRRAAQLKRIVRQMGLVESVPWLPVVLFAWTVTQHDRHPFLQSSWQWRPATCREPGARG
jgi:hypothetical protein